MFKFPKTNILASVLNEIASKTVHKDEEGDRQRKKK